MLLLWGFMGAGKSTIGNYCEKKYGWKHIDTDSQIEIVENMSISQIFEQKGEAYFRNLETNYLQKFNLQHKKFDPSNQIILTTGGGMPIREENRKWMQELGITIYIHVSFEEIIERLQSDTTRPLWDKEQIDSMKLRFDERLDYYNKADIIIKADGKTVEEIGYEIYLAM